MSHDDVLFGFRLRLFSLATEIGVRPACREKWGGLKISPNGVWRVLRRQGLSTRQRRLSLVAGYAAHYERRPAASEPERHVQSSRPGEL